MDDSPRFQLNNDASFRLCVLLLVLAVCLGATGMVMGLNLHV